MRRIEVSILLRELEGSMRRIELFLLLRKEGGMRRIELSLLLRVRGKNEAHRALLSP